MSFSALMEALTSLTQHLSSGADRIRMLSLMYCREEINNPLIHLVNSTPIGGIYLEEVGVVPDGG